MFARPQDTDLLFVDIGPRALKFTKDVDLQINTKTREKLEQTFEFMKKCKKLTDLEIKSIFPSCKNQEELSSLLFRESKKMFYTNFDPEKQTLSLMSAKIGGLHLAKNFLSIESEIKQSIAEEQPLETIMTKFAISISKLNIHTTDTIIQSVAEGKTQLIELIFAAGNNIPLQARVQLRYYFYVYLEELMRRASVENLQEIIQEIIREISQ